MYNNVIGGISWPIEFGCTLFIDNLVIPNFYTIKINLAPYNEDQDFTDGLRKIRYFVDSFLHNSIFINANHELIASLSKIDTNIVSFIDEPYDFLVAGTLLQKFTTISKKYFDIEYLLIDSILGDKIQYFILDPAEAGIPDSNEYWWNQDSANSGGQKIETWEKLDITDMPKFSPKVIKGGLSEH